MLALPSPATNLNANKDISISLPSDETISIPNMTFPSHPLNNSNVPLTCYTNQPASTRQFFQPVDLFACEGIFPSILLLPDVLETKTWTPWSPVTLPYTYTAGNCRIELWTRIANARDVFPEVEILRRAAMIITSCMSDRPAIRRYGGMMSVGVKALFQVSVSHT